MDDDINPMILVFRVHNWFIFWLFDYSSANSSTSHHVNSSAISYFAPPPSAEYKFTTACILLKSSLTLDSSTLRRLC